MNYIALLRGINVGGNKLVSMADLRELALGLGYLNPRTYVQSGNLVFGAEGRNHASLETELEKEIEAKCGVRNSVIIRSAPEWDRVIAANPFSKEAEEDPSHLLVQFLKTRVVTEEVEALKASNPGRERIVAGDRHLYITYPDGVGESKLAGSLIGKHIKSPSTGRNWNTVLKLAAMARTSG